MHSTGKKLWMGAKDYIMIVLGILIYGIGFCAFILPEEVVIGGVSGIGSLFFFASQKYLPFEIPVWIPSYAINLVLLAFAYKIVGKQFVMRTVFGATVISLVIAIMQPLFYHLLDGKPLVEGETFINIIIGGICCGAGIGMAFIHNGSTGGTDIVAAITAKKTNVSIGRTMLYTDFFIISSSYLIFQDPNKIVFGLIVLFLASWTADQIINTNRQAIQFTIFSPKWEEIADAINSEANRGATLIDGEGGYTHNRTKIVMVVCNKRETSSVMSYVRDIDPNAFMTVASVMGVYGRGFQPIKL